MGSPHDKAPKKDSITEYELKAREGGKKEDLPAVPEVCRKNPDEVIWRGYKGRKEGTVRKRETAW